MTTPSVGFVVTFKIIFKCHPVFDMSDDTSDGVRQVCEKVPCRRQQAELLSLLFGQKEHVVVQSLFLYGHTSTGKSLLVDTLLRQLKARYVVVNCVECYTAKLLYERILNELSGVIPSPSNDYAIYRRCDNMDDFIHYLRLVEQQEGLSGETVYIVFDKAERLRSMDANLLPVFLRLQELSGGLNVCVLLLSEIVWEKFRQGTGVREPYVIHFPDYTADELLEIMSLDCPADFSYHCYAGYIKLLLSVFHSVCRNLSELRHLAWLNFAKYIEPIEKGEASLEDSRKLWRNVEPHLRRALCTVYLREVSSAQWERLQQTDESSSHKATDKTLQGVSSWVNMELPYYSKYLLIAAYIASYNPAKSDRKFFAKHSGRVNKRVEMNSHKKQEQTNNQLLGPKPFPLDRLMAIFYVIVEGKVALSANIYSQISSLVTLGLMMQLSSSEPLDAPRYKCLISLDFVKSVARTINFEVLRYLYDFAC
ncbi:Origin recognition complex subunit 5 [Lamellibrachia satsuma]|nr:Origin recognition complex subunit 5 [Lamellibrachia satsuma]